MKLVQINTVCNCSTGKIMGDIQREANKNGYDTISFYGRGKGYNDLKCEKFGNSISFWIHVILNTLFDNQGHGSYFCTKKLIKRLREENPDIIHLHNLHGYYLSIPLLYKYLKEEYKGKIFWTFHDCWPFTGHCAYFTAVKCNKWKKQCYKCPNKKEYPVSLFKDNSYNNYLEKKNMFTGLSNLTIITPSDWLNKLVKQSFLKKYNVVTINNGIDLNVFKPIIDKSILTKFSIPCDKKILLGVASVWDKRKGLDDFLKLSNELPKEYIIVLVGLNNHQIKMASCYNNIIGIKRTENVNDLVKLYSIAYCFLNLTYEDNYPTVNMEAIACGTPVITYNTGGCSEQVNTSVGIVTTFDELLKSISKIKSFKFYNKDYLSRIDKNILFKDIIDKYK